MTIQIDIRITHKVIFPNDFETGYILRIGFDLMEKSFFVQTSEGTNSTEKGFAPQNEPNTAKCFSGILKHFCVSFRSKI